MARFTHTMAITLAAASLSGPMASGDLSLPGRLQ